MQAKALTSEDAKLAQKVAVRLSIIAHIVLSLAAAVAVLPLLLKGPSCGHDFDFHILSWIEAANQFSHFGYPHWAFTPAWNAGEPRFVFYPPLSWTLGAALGLILPWNVVPAAFTWIALMLSGLTMHRLARRFASPQAALLAATLYLANPYMLFTAYERTAYGELLAAAWLPLLFAAALAPQITLLRIAFPVALLWLTNAPAAVMSCYALAFLLAIRLAQQAWLEAAKWNASHGGRTLDGSQSPSAPTQREAPLWKFLLLQTVPPALVAAAGTALGLAMTAFYLIPAAYEQRFVQVSMAIIPGMRPQEHFLFHRMGTASFDDLFHDQVVRTASIVALLMLAGIAAALLAAWRSRSSQSPLPALGVLALLIAFLLAPASLFLWNHLPKLAFLQFPWRLSALLGVILALAVAMAGHRPKPSTLLSLLPIPLVLLLVLPAWHFFQQPCDAEDTVPARLALFHSDAGTEPTDEYTPNVDDNDALSHADPPYWLLPSSGMPVPGGNSVPVSILSATGGPPPDAQPGQAPSHLVLDLSQPEYLVLNRRKFPFWQILVNGHASAPPAATRALPPALQALDRQRQSRPDGLIVVSLPSGHSTVDLVYRRTPDQTAGLTLSAVTGIATLALARRRRPPV